MLTSTDIKKPWENIAKSFTAGKSESFPFLKLPNVIRRRVFEILLTEAAEKDGNHGVVQIKELARTRFKSSWRRSFYMVKGMRVGRIDVLSGNPLYAESYGSEHGHCTQLFRVCKQLYREAAPIFYSMNLFSFETARPLLLFLIDRRVLSRDYLAAISVPFPDVAPGEADVQFDLGCTIDWQGQPRHTDDMGTDNIWHFFARMFNDLARNYPNLEVLDFRVPVIRYWRPHVNLGKRWLWLPAHGYRVLESCDLSQLDVLRDLSIVTISNHTVVKDVQKVYGQFHVSLHAGAVRKLGEDSMADGDEMNLPPPHNPEHVTGAELRAFKRNYAFVYGLTSYQRGTIARLVPVIPEREYNRYASSADLLTTRQVAELAASVNKENGRTPAASIPSLILQSLARANPREGTAPFEAPLSHTRRLTPAVRAAVQRLKGQVVDDTTANRDWAYEEETPPDVLRVTEKECFLMPLSERNKAAIRAVGRAAAVKAAAEPPATIEAQLTAAHPPVAAALAAAANGPGPATHPVATHGPGPVTYPIAMHGLGPATYPIAMHGPGAVTQPAASTQSTAATQTDTTMADT